MDENGEDRISALHESVVSHILSSLPTKDAVRTSVLSKGWRYKWTSIYNINLDDKRTSLRGKIKGHSFSNFILRVLHLTQNSTIKSFRLWSTVKLDSQYLKRCIDSVLVRGVQNVEINTNRCGGNIFAKSLFNCTSLTKLELHSECTLSTSLVKNGISNLKFLCLGCGVQLRNDDISKNVDVSLNFSILEELELKYCSWLDVKTVEINAPALIGLLAFSDIYTSQNCVIKINGPKLEKFLSSGSFPYHFALIAPSISNVVLTNSGVGDAFGFRANEMLKGVPSLQYLKLSSEVVEALRASETIFHVPCFNLLKHLEILNHTVSEEGLMNLVQSMSSLETLSFYMKYENSNGLRSLPVCIASHLKVVKLGYFRGSEAQMHRVESVLKNAKNLKKLYVFVCHGASISTNQIKQLLATYSKSSHRASIEVIGPRFKVASPDSSQTNSEQSAEADIDFGKFESRCVKRRDLLETLARELPQGTVRYSSKIVSIQESGNFKFLQLTDGSVIKSRVLIGCDGVNSIVAKWLGLENPVKTGRSAIRGFVEYPDGHGFEPKFHAYFGGGVRYGFIPCDDKSIYWFCTFSPALFKYDENDDNPFKMKQFVLSNISYAPKQVSDIVERTGTDNISSATLKLRLPWNILFRNIVKNNVCVVGDALHPMTPDIGQGGCSALEDSIVLARCLANALLAKAISNDKGKDEKYAKMQKGLEKYSKERRWRSFSLISTAYVVGLIQEKEGKIMNFLRKKFLSKYNVGFVVSMADFDCGKLIVP